MKYILSTLIAGLVACIPGYITAGFYSAACDVVPHMTTASEAIIASVCWLVVIFLASITLACFFGVLNSLIDAAESNRCSSDDSLLRFQYDAERALPYPYTATVTRRCGGGYNLTVTHAWKIGTFDDHFYGEMGLELSAEDAERYFDTSYRISNPFPSCSGKIYKDGKAAAEDYTCTVKEQLADITTGGCVTHSHTLRGCGSISYTDSAKFSVKVVLNNGDTVSKNFSKDVTSYGMYYDNGEITKMCDHIRSSYENQLKEVKALESWDNVDCNEPVEKKPCGCKDKKKAKKSKKKNKKG